MRGDGTQGTDWREPLPGVGVSHGHRAAVRVCGTDDLARGLVLCQAFQLTKIQ